MQRTKEKGPAGRTSRQWRGSASQTQGPRRFQRSRKPELSGTQKLMQGIRGVLPGGGKSSQKRGKKARGAGRGRKPAMLGVLGAGAAGAAAAAATRRSRSSRPQAADAGATPEAQTAPTPTPPAPASPPADRPDGPVAEDQRD